MEALKTVVSFLLNAGVSVIMPIIMTIFAVILGAKFGKALRAGLLVGVGFIGLNLVIGLLSDSMGPATQAMVKRFHLALTTVDVGWPSCSAIAFGSVVGTLIIPVVLIINIIMLVTKTTQTMDVDIWDYWHFAFTGALVAVLTKSVGWGILAAALNAVIVLVLADITAPGVEKYLDLPGVSLPHGFTTAFVPLAIVVNKLLDLIPGVNKINISSEKVQKKFGVFGEPILVGTVIGIVIGIVAGYDFTKVLALGVTLGGVLVLIPRMAALLMEGLIPVSEQAQEFLRTKLKYKGKIYIGLDSAVGVGNPTAMAVSLILIPTSLLIAVILPGNTFLPFADLAVIPWMFVLIVPITKGDFFRSFIIGVVDLIIGFWIATDLAPMITVAARQVNFHISSGVTTIASICDGANPLTWAITRLIGNFFVIGAVIVAVVAIGMAIWNRRRIIKELNSPENGQAAATEEQ